MRLFTTALVAAATAAASAPAFAQCSSGTAHHTPSAQAVINNASWSNTHGEPNIVETAKSAGSFNTLLAAVKAAGLADALMGEGPFTVFAPTDEAFGNLPEGTVAHLLEEENLPTLRAILSYHVIPAEVMATDVVNLTFAETLSGQRVDIDVRQGNVFIDDAQVIKTDIETSNGVIHVIDRVIMPETKTLAGVAQEAGSFGTLIAAAQAAGLVEALSGDQPLTVFAPTDEAFAKLGQDTIASLLKRENRDQLAAVLKYHVVAGRVYADQAVTAGSAETLQGGSVRIRIQNGQARVNDSNITATDIEASNGVIHVIDTVLIPG